MEEGDEEDPDVVYTSLCSKLTLQSSKRGFFGAFADYVTEAAVASGWLENSFRTRQTDAGRINAIIEDKEIYGIVSETLSHVRELYRHKSAANSRERRNEAQTALKDGDFTKALVLSSQAVLRAPMPDNDDLIEGGISLALALWLRSECLLNLKEYDLALRDLKMALKERLPAKQRAEYYWRVGKCYKGLGEYSRSKVSLDLAVRLLGSNVELKRQVENDIDDLKKAEETMKSKDKTIKDNEINLSGGCNKEFTALSKYVSIAFEPGKGRYAKASSKISAGDVILMEDPYAACLIPEMLGSHCCNCFQKLIAPVWCPTCVAVAFCSSECRDFAVQSYHAFECKFLDLLIGSGMSILCHIALRMVTQAGLQRSLEIHKKNIIEMSVNEDDEKKSEMLSNVKIKSPKPIRNKRIRHNKKIVKEKNANEETNDDSEKQNNVSNEKSKNEEKRESLIYSLCTHSDRRNSKDFLNRAIMALFLLKCLQKSNFFIEKGDPNTLTSSELAIGELLLRNLQLLQFNAHEIYETVMSLDHKFNGSKTTYLAVGIYPSGALFNHECHPAVARYFIGKKIVMTAIRPLTPNSVVAENYGPNFLIKTKAERQRALYSRYWFKCDCVACKQDWPTLKQMENDAIPKLRCPNKTCERTIQCAINKEGDKIWSKTCPGCKVKIDNYDMLKIYETLQFDSITQYQVGAKRMEEQNAIDASNILTNAINTFYEYASPPHKDTLIAQESLRSCVSIKGNTRIVS